MLTTSALLRHGPIFAFPHPTYWSMAQSTSHIKRMWKSGTKKYFVRLHLKFIIDQFQPLHPSFFWNAEMETMQQRNQRLNMTSRGQMDIGPVDVDFQMFVSRYPGSWTFNWTVSQISTFHQMLGKKQQLAVVCWCCWRPGGFCWQGRQQWTWWRRQWRTMNWIECDSCELYDYMIHPQKYMYRSYVMICFDDDDAADAAALHYHCIPWKTACPQVKAGNQFSQASISS